MKKSVLKISGLIVAGLVLAGCSQATETLVEAGTGADVEISEEGMTVTGEDGSTLTVDEEEGSMTYTDEEGTTSVQSGGDVQVPDGVPSDLPLPTEAVLVTAAENDGVYVLAWTWEGFSKEAFTAYVDSVESAGYSKTLDVIDLDLGDGAFSLGYVLSDGTNDVTLAGVSDDTGMGQVNMTIGPAS